MPEVRRGMGGNWLDCPACRSVLFAASEMPGSCVFGMTTFSAGMGADFPRSQDKAGGISILFELRPKADSANYDWH
jgi:hypothetical protein